TQYFGSAFRASRAASRPDLLAPDSGKIGPWSRYSPVRRCTEPIRWSPREAETESRGPERRRRRGSQLLGVELRGGSGHAAPRGYSVQPGLNSEVCGPLAPIVDGDAPVSTSEERHRQS